MKVFIFVSNVEYDVVGMDVVLDCDWFLWIVVVVVFDGVGEGFFEGEFDGEGGVCVVGWLVYEYYDFVSYDFGFVNVVGYDDVG